MHGNHPQDVTHYVSNAAWLIGDSVFGKAFGLIVVAVVARLLGPQDYGMYAYVMSMIALFTVIGHMGLDGLVVRELVSKPDEQPQIIGTVLGLKGAGYVVGAILVLAYSLLMPNHQSQERWLFLVAVPGMLCMPLISVLKNWFNARVEARYGVIANLGATLSSGVFKILMVLGGAGVVAVGVGTTLGTVTGALLIVVLYWRRGGPRPASWQFSATRARGLFNEGWMIFAGVICANVFLKIDLVMLRMMQGPQEVATYAVASLISEATYFIPAALGATVFPRLVQSSAIAPKAFLAGLQKLFDLLAFAGIGLFVTLMIIGPPLIHLAFGASYAPSATILMIHLFSLPFIFVRQGFNHWVLVANKARFFLSSQALGAMINVLLNLVLIPGYGGHGAAVATVISYAASSLFVLLAFSDTRAIFRLSIRSLGQPWRGWSLVKQTMRQLVR